MSKLEPKDKKKDQELGFLERMELQYQEICDLDDEISRMVGSLQGDELTIEQIVELQGQGRQVGSSEKVDAGPSMHDTWGALGDDKWKEMIRGGHQGTGMGKHGYDASDKSLGQVLKRGESYSASWDRASDRVGHSLGTELDVDGLQAIHDTATEHLGRIGWRNEKSGDGHGHIGIGLLDGSVSEQGIAEAKGGPMTYRGRTPDREVGSGMFERGEHRLQTATMSEEEVKAAATKLLGTYYARIQGARDDDERLDLIAGTVQELARLHPFENGNTRTVMLVLNKFLTEQGLTPAIVDDPKDFYMKSHDEWRTEIARGMAAWRVEAKKKGWVDKHEEPKPSKEEKSGSSDDDLDLDDLC